MIREIVAFAQSQAKAAVRRAAVPAAFALVAGLFVLFAAACLFAALFFWLEPKHGPIIAVLVCAGVALVLAILTLLPLMFRRRPPPPSPEASLPQLLSLIAKAAPNLGPRQLVLTAALIGVALALSVRGNKK